MGEGVGKMGGRYNKNWGCLILLLTGEKRLYRYIFTISLTKIDTRLNLF